jgi:ubiquinol-cytochrome c reductase cytochrome b subunit
MFLMILLVDVLILGYVGGAEATKTNVLIGQITTAYYFLHFLVILPIVSATERPKPVANSITEAVLKGKGGTSPGHSAIEGQPNPMPAE